jgi:hypothetical protein
VIDNDTIKVVEKIIHILPLLSFLFGLLTFAIGVIVGHYNAISRDRRKEFNENAEPLLEYYDELYIELTEPGYMSTTKFPIHSLGKIARRLSPYKGRKFMALVKEIISLKTNI